MLLFPIRTDRPRLRPAYLTVALIVVNTAVQLYSMSQPEVPVQVTLAGETVATRMAPVIKDFGLWGSHPTVLTFLSHQFVHGNLLHLGGNMLFLWIFGSLIEDAIRPWGLALLYLGGGIMAAIAHITLSALTGADSNVPMVGASGAVAAIMGLFTLRFHLTRVEIYYFFMFFLRGSFWVRSIWALLYWIALEVFSGLLDAVISGGGGGVAHWAHVGGFVAGLAYAPFLGTSEQARREYVTDDPETNVEYLRRMEFVTAAEKALKADPGNAYLILRLARAQRDAGEYEQATLTYLACLERFAGRNMADQAAEVFLELRKHDDTVVIPVETLVKIGQHLETSRIPEAVYTYWALAAQHPATPQGEYALLRVGVLYAQSLRQPVEAARYLDAFLERYPGSRWASYARSLRASLA